MLKALTIAGTLIAAAAPAAAQSIDPLVAAIAATARQHFGHARAIVDPSIDRETVRRGAKTAQIQACGGQWDRLSFLPFMAQLRASGRYSEQQLAYIAVVHGMAQQRVYTHLTARAEPCPAAARAALAR
ncbi:MAG TPA: hypothetical protein VEZ70_07105 [Allosphingosinicella sp.]|nr:hypothetical protein [Allosphingosinicella sp.]